MNYFKLREKEGLKYLSIIPFEKTGLVKHCFTTRTGGVSTGPYDSLNLGLNKDEDKDITLENYNRICKAINIDMNNLVTSNQVHKDNIYIVDDKDLGKGIVKPTDILNVDGLITNQRGIPLITYYADCVPLFFLDPIKKIIGLCHAGWKGTSLNIGVKTVKMMKTEFGAKMEDVLVGIGPSIGKCCYEVDEPVIKAIEKIVPDWENYSLNKKTTGKWNIDLASINVVSLTRVGLKRENIYESEICTSCFFDTYFSYRRSKGKTGSMAAIIELI